jgi:hypothetical protein
MFLWLLPLLITFIAPAVVQISDFLMTFYVAGRMVQEGRASQLYPDPAATSLLTTAFNTYAHQMLDKLPAGKIAVYMYPPLTAYLFQALGSLSPQAAMIIWQVLSIAAFWFVVKFFSSLKHKTDQQYFWTSILYFPILQTLLLGHLGIVLGLLPLSAGYWLLMNERPILAGLVFSALWLKPQFLPVALLLAGVLALTRRFSFMLSFLLGTLLLVLATVICLGPEVSTNWVLSLKLSDTIFSDPRYGYSAYLVSSLPGAVLQILPFGLRSTAKLVIYPLAFAIGLHGLFSAWRILNKAGKQYLSALPFVFLIGIFILPFVFPHFLFYDLIVLALGAMIIYSNQLWKLDLRLRRDLLLGWLWVDLYLPLAALGKLGPVLPFVLLAILIVLYVRILRLGQTWAAGISDQMTPLK